MRTNCLLKWCLWHTSKRQDLFLTHLMLPLVRCDLLAFEGITEECGFFSYHLEWRNKGNNSIGIFGRAQEDDSNQEVEQLRRESLRQGCTLKRNDESIKTSLFFVTRKVTKTIEPEQ